MIQVTLAASVYLRDDETASLAEPQDPMKAMGQIFEKAKDAMGMAVGTANPTALAEKVKKIAEEVTKSLGNIASKVMT